MAECTHLDQVQLTELPESTEGCEECLKIGDGWCHLRICLTCGKVGCCDSSPNRHAHVHSEESGHALMHSLQPDEDWSWCFVDELALLIEGIEGTTQIPPSPLGC